MSLSELFAEVEGKEGRRLGNTEARETIERDESAARQAREVNDLPVRQYESKTILAYGAQDLILDISSERKKIRRRDTGKR